MSQEYCRNQADASVSLFGLVWYCVFDFFFFSCYFGIQGRRSVNTDVYQSIESWLCICPRVKAVCMTTGHVFNVVSLQSAAAVAAGHIIRGC